MNDEYETYADWYIWAKRNLSSDPNVGHGAAAAATEAVLAGGDRTAAIAAARQSLARAAHLAAESGDIRRRTYAEWFDWARRELGGVREQQQAAARAALGSLDQGQGANSAMAAARAAHDPGGAPPAPGLPAMAPPPPAAPYAPAGYPVPVPPPPPPYAVAAVGNPYAGFWRRLAAWAIDQVILGVAGGLIGVLLGIGIAIGAAATGGSPTVSTGTTDALTIPLYILGAVIGWLYFTICEASPWQATPGKLALGIKVTDLAGNRIGWGRANARFWSKLISGITLGIGYLMVAFTERKQGLHDMIAGTLVVRR